MELIEAAGIVAAGYRGAEGLDVAERHLEGGVECYLLRGGTLVLPGTNETSDWFDFNLAVNSTFLGGALDRRLRLHRGFLAYAERVHGFCREMGPQRIVGHSLGAAAAQILATVFRIPAICFASPRTLKDVGARTRVPGEGWALNICRTDDRVCGQPPKILGWRCLGSRYELSPRFPELGLDHPVPAYVRLLQDRDAAAHVPKTWPERV